MAWRDVELTEEEKKGGGGDRFKKFKQIGDEHVGVWLGTRTEAKDFHDGRGVRNLLKYVFFTAKDGEFELDAAYDLDRKFAKAQRPESDGGFGLKPYDGKGRPHFVSMKWDSTQDVGQSSPMKIIKLRVNTEPRFGKTDAEHAANVRLIPTLAPQQPQGGQHSAPPPDRAPPPPPEDDIPF